MPYNGSGLFTRVYNWVTDKNNSVNITASRMDAEMDGMATGLSTAITKDGQTTITADIPFNGKKITGLGNGTNSADAVNKSQLDAAAAAGAPVGASYVVVSADGTLTAERSLAGEASVVSITDGGANAAITVGLSAAGVTNAKLANMATARLKGRATGTTGAPEDVTITQALDMVPGTPTGGDLIARDTAAYARVAAGSSGNVLQSNGSGALPTWVAPSTAATQAQMEAAAVNTAWSAPSVQHHHPGHPKAWVRFTPRGTNGACTITSQYNVSGVTRDAGGTYTVTFTTPFSSTTYLMVGSPRFTSVLGASVSQGTPATGSCVVYLTDSAGGAYDSASSVNCVFLGDQ